MTLEDSGTQTATGGGVADTLTTLTTKLKSLVLVVDTVNMVNGDTVELNIYEKCLSGGTERLAYSAAYRHVQSIPMKFSPPVPSDISFRAELVQSGAGTDKDFPWKVLSL